MTTDTDNIILMSHGGGGTRTSSLIKDVILKHLDNELLAKLDDAVCLSVPEPEIVFTTDSYVVQPVFFPGGDIGKLAACGTINDLAMQGAIPKYLSLGLILEEGLPVSDLEEIIQSLAAVLKETGTSVVTGDTKVVEHGSGTGITINTTGIGVLHPKADVHVANAKEGDVIIATGTIGDHGIAIMSCREGLRFETELVSDVAPLCGLSQRLLDAVPSVHCLRDPTRGGVAAALCDIAEKSGTGIIIEESSIPVRKEVNGACNMLGLDPLNVANEGKALVICSEEDSQMALETILSDPLGKDARIIGYITSEHEKVVTMKTLSGGERIIETPSGENLPRIC